MKKRIFLLLICLAVSVFFVSCMGLLASTTSENDQNTEEPELTVDYVYSLAKAGGYSGSVKEFIKEFKGEDGADGEDGEDGVGILTAALDENYHLIITLTNGNVIDCGKLSVNIESNSQLGIGENGNWYINGEDTGKRAVATDGTQWLTGSNPPISTLGAEGDLYLNTKTCDVYKKISGVWSVIANIAGEGVTVVEGDDYNVTVNSNTTPDRYAAAKGLMSAVRVEAVIYSTSQYKQISSGSGIIYKLDKSSGDAYIVTNFHVVYNTSAKTENHIAEEIYVYLYGLEYEEYAIKCEFVGGAMTYDVAVLKVTGNELLKTSIAREVDIADSNDVSVLDTAIAIGNAASSGISATFGKINVLSEYLEMVAPDDKTTVDYRVMRIDTPVNGGNSGGGVFNDEGMLIGLVMAKEKDSSIENMGYAIPSNIVTYVAENLIRNCDGKDNEKILKGHLGIGIVTSEVTTVYDEEKGIIRIIETCKVSEVETGSLAETLFLVDDIIKSIEIDGILYEVNHSYDSGEIFLNAAPDSEIYVNIERDGSPMKIEVNLNKSNFVTVQ